jgi:hypothetical protein
LRISNDLRSPAIAIALTSMGYKLLQTHAPSLRNTRFVKALNVQEALA